MISITTVRTLTNRYMEEAGFDKDKAIKLCNKIADENLRLLVINRIKGMR